MQRSAASGTGEAKDFAGAFDVRHAQAVIRQEVVDLGAIVNDGVGMPGKLLIDARIQAEARRGEIDGDGMQPRRESNVPETVASQRLPQTVRAVLAAHDAPDFG